MSNRAQRVLCELIKFNAEDNSGYPIITIRRFFDANNSAPIDRDVSEDYELLTTEEEKQVIKAFLEIAY